MTTWGSTSVFGLTLMERSCFHGYSLFTRGFYSSTFVTFHQLNARLEAVLTDLLRTCCSQRNEDPALRFALSAFSFSLCSFPLVLPLAFLPPVSPPFSPKAETKPSFLPTDSLESTSDGGQSFILLPSVLSLSSLLETLRWAIGQKHQDPGCQRFPLGPPQVPLLRLQQRHMWTVPAPGACSLLKEPVVLLVLREARLKL